MQSHHVAARALFLACVSVGAFACGGASMLRGPIADRCASADLKGCDDISDGVVLVVSGDKAAGLKKVERGAGENGPDRVRAFADTLGDIASTPGFGSYATELSEVAYGFRCSRSVALDGAHDEITAQDVDPSRSCA